MVIGLTAVFAFGVLFLWFGTTGGVLKQTGDASRAKIFGVAFCAISLALGALSLIVPQLGWLSEQVSS